MDYRHILLEISPASGAVSMPFSAAVARLTINRPERRNATDDVTLRELTHAFRILAGRPDLRAVIVAGAGKDFCAGADIEWMRRAGTYRPAQGRKDARLLAEMCQAVDECPIPVIARAQGAIYGGGLGLISTCDIVVASENATMCFSECRLGILPAVVSCWVLPKLGAAAARRYYLTAEVFDMEVARDMGLVHIIAPESELDERVETLVGSILRNGPHAVREAKALLRKFPGKSLSMRLKIAIDTLIRLRSSPEGQEGLSAFLEKRPPAWLIPKQ
jgi:methylglutaconyl-CoA hydratase